MVYVLLSLTARLENLQSEAPQCKMRLGMLNRGVRRIRNAKSGTVRKARRDTKTAVKPNFRCVERASEVVWTSFPILYTPTVRSG